MDKFRLSWSEHHSMLQSVFARLLVAEQFVDVTISCSGKNIRCHRVVLSACSTYFENLLITNQCPHPIVVMRDIGFEEMSNLVNFMYFGEVTIEEEKLPSLLKSAEFLEIKGLGSNLSSDTSGSVKQKLSEKVKDSRKRPSSSMSNGSSRQTKKKVDSEDFDESYEPEPDEEEEDTLETPRRSSARTPTSTTKLRTSRSVSRAGNDDEWSPEEKRDKKREKGKESSLAKTPGPKLRLPAPIPAIIIQEGKNTYLDHEGNRYRVKARYGGGRYWRCGYRGCEARLTTNAESEIVYMKGEHFHLFQKKKQTTPAKKKRAKFSDDDERDSDLEEADLSSLVVKGAGVKELETVNAQDIVFTIGEPVEASAENPQGADDRKA